MKKAEKILAAAKTAASSCETWADLSNALFDPEEGEVIIVAQYFFIE